MHVATLTSKGQVTIPLAVRQESGLTSGDKIEFIREKNGKYAIIPKSGTVKSLEGFLKWDGAPVSIEEMEEAIIEGALS